MQNKKITVITYTPFWLESNGCQQRISGLLKLLQQAKFKIDLIFVEYQQRLTDADLQTIKQNICFDRVFKVHLVAHSRLKEIYFLIKHRLKQMFPHQIIAWLESKSLIGTSGKLSNNNIISVGHFERMVNAYVRKQVQRILQILHPDAIIVEYADLGYILDGLVLNCLKIVDTHDALHLHDNSFFNLGLEKCYAVTAEEEHTALNRFDIIIAIQDKEQKLFQKLCPDKQVITLLPWIPVRTVKAKANSENNLLFLGFNNKANLHGIKKFLADTWPFILNYRLNTKLLIGGTISSEIDAKQYKNVECLGFFENLDDFYCMGEIAINPVVAGSGLKIKTLEALTRGKICIASPHSAAGLNLFIGHGLEIANTSEEYVILITKYLTDINLRKKKMEESINVAKQVISAENCLQPLIHKFNCNKI